MNRHRKPSISESILLTLSVILFVAMCLISVSRVNTSFDSDAAACIMQAEEMLKHKTLFPSGWNDSTYIHFHTIPTLIALLITPDYLQANALAALISIFIALTALLFFCRFGLNRKDSLLIIVLYYSYLSGTQEQMLFTAHYYTQFIISFFICIGCWLCATEMPFGERLRIRRRFLLCISFFLLFVCNFQGMRTLQQLTLPLAGTVLLMHLFETGDDSKSLIKAIAIAILALLAGGCGCFISQAVFEPLVGVNEFSSDSFLTFAVSLDNVAKNFSVVWQAILTYWDFPYNISIFSLAGIQGMLKLVVMFSMTFILPILSIKEYPKLCYSERFLLIFSLLNSFEVLFLLLFSHGSNHVGAARYLLFNLMLLAVVGCQYLYRHVFSRTRPVTYLSVVFIAAYSLICTLPMINFNAESQIRQSQELTNYLAENDLHYGYATFWNASNHTFYSNGNVKIRAMNIHLGRITPYRWLSSDEWYLPDAYTGKTFLMLTEDELNTYLPEDGYEATSLGSPAEILEYKNNVILVYDHNIATANFTRYHLRSMHLTRPEKRREDGTILLEYDDIMYGPYIHLGSGDYVLTIEAETEVEAELRITSYTTSGPIGEYTLSNGVNTFAFSLQDGAENIEFFLHNTSDSPIVIQNITLTQIN